MFECGQSRQWWTLRPGGRIGSTLPGRRILNSHLEVHFLAIYHNYKKISNILPNRADFWALAGIIAVDKGIENANEDCDSDDCAVPDSGLAFQWGRQVSDNIPSIIVHSIVISPAFG